MGEVIEVGVEEFQHDLARYIETVGQGRTVVVMRDGRAVARFGPPEVFGPDRSSEMPWGVLRGQIWMAPDFDEWPEDILESFEAWDY